MQLNSHVHIQQRYWPLTPNPDAITILESHRASRLVHNTININVLWLRRLWKNFLPHQYWWCCHTLESGSSLRIYKRNTAGGSVSVCEGGLCHFWWCTFSCRSEQFPWERGDSNPRLMRSERRGVVQRQIQFPCNALPEMIVMEKWTFHFRGSGNAKWGCVDSGNGGIAFGTSSQTVLCWATHIDTDPIHYNISFGDALLYISRVERVHSVKSFTSGAFVMHSDINHTEEKPKKILMKLPLNFGFSCSPETRS